MSRTKEIASSVEQPIYFLTTDLVRADEASDLGQVQGMTIETLFPKELPVPKDGAALIVDLDYLCLDRHGIRQWERNQLKKPLHHTMLVVSHNLDALDEGLLEDQDIRCSNTLDATDLAALAWDVAHDLQRERSHEREAIIDGVVGDEM